MKFNKHISSSLILTAILTFLPFKVLADGVLAQVKSSVFTDCMVAKGLISKLSPEEQIDIISFLKNLVFSRDNFTKQIQPQSPGLTNKIGGIPSTVDESRVGDLVTLSNPEREAAARSCGLGILPMLSPATDSLIPLLFALENQENLPQSVKDIIPEQVARWIASIKDETTRISILTEAITTLVSQESSSAENAIIEIAPAHIPYFFERVIISEMAQVKIERLVDLFDIDRTLSTPMLRAMIQEPGVKRTLAIKLLHQSDSLVILQDKVWSANLFADANVVELFDLLVRLAPFFPEGQSIVRSSLKGADPQDVRNILKVLASFSSIQPETDDEILKLLQKKIISVQNDNDLIYRFASRNPLSRKWKGILPVTTKTSLPTPTLKPECQIFPNKSEQKKIKIQPQELLNKALNCFQQNNLTKEGFLEFFKNPLIPVDARKLLFISTVQNVLYDKVLRSYLLSQSADLMIDFETIKPLFENFIADSDPVVQINALQAIQSYPLNLEGFFGTFKHIAEPTDDTHSAEVKLWALIALSKTSSHQLDRQSDIVELMKDSFESPQLAIKITEKQSKFPPMILTQAVEDTLTGSSIVAKQFVLKALVEQKLPHSIELVSTLIKLTDSKVTELRDLSMILVLQIAPSSEEAKRFLSQMIFDRRRVLLLSTQFPDELKVYITAAKAASKTNTEQIIYGRLLVSK